MSTGDFMNTYYIYKVTNKQNGKIYIGKTNNIGQRIRQHLSSCKNRDTEFHKALNDEGFANFTWEFLECVNSQETASDLEREYIEMFHSLVPNGYNLSPSSGGVPQYNAIVCLTKDGKLVKRYSYLREAVKDGFNVSSIIRSIKTNYRTAKGYIFMNEDDYNKYGPKDFIIKENAQKKKVVQCDLLGNYVNEFNSVSEASDMTGFARSNISANLTGASKTCNGFIFVYKTDFPIKDIEKYKHAGKGIKIAQIDKETGDILKIFNSIKEAGDSIGRSYKNIQKVMNKPTRTAYGFKWKSI